MSVTTQPPGADSRGGAEFRAALDALMAEAFAFGTRFISDAKVRRAYMDATREAAQEMLWRAQSGRITYTQAATEANLLRNAILDAARAQTSEVMLAYVRSLKKDGLTLAELIERHGREMFGKAPAELTAAERERVMRRILEGAARSRPSVNAAALRLARLGRGLVALSIGIAVYNVWQADDPARQAVKEGAVLGAGVAGSALGGIVAGSLFCGPAAFVCMGVGVLVGGALFSFGVSLALD